MSYSLQTPSINAITRAACSFHSGGYKYEVLSGTTSRRKQRRHLLKMGFSTAEVEKMLLKMGYAEPKQRMAK